MFVCVCVMPVVLFSFNITYICFWSCLVSCERILTRHLYKYFCSATPKVVCSLCQLTTVVARWEHNNYTTFCSYFVKVLSSFGCNEMSCYWAVRICFCRQVCVSYMVEYVLHTFLTVIRVGTSRDAPLIDPDEIWLMCTDRKRVSHSINASYIM